MDDKILAELTGIKTLLVLGLLKKKDEPVSQEKIALALGITQGQVSKLLSSKTKNNKEESKNGEK